MHTIKTVLMRAWKEYQCDCGFVGTTTKETLAHVGKDQK